MDRTTLGFSVCIVFVLLALCGSYAASRQLQEAATTSPRTLLYPIPSHVVRMTDKLHVQKWIDAARAEIAASPVRVDAACDARFGQGYLDKWREAKRDVCVRGTSTFTCYEHPHNDRGNNRGSLFCAVNNLVLDSADFLGDVMTRPEARVAQGGAKFPNPKRGSARVACTLAQPLPWSREEASDNHADKWLYDALAPAPAAEVEAACADPARTVAGPVYFVTRMDPTNAFHHYEEVNNFFAAMWLYPHKEVLQQGITIVALDGAVPGFYLELWRRIAYPYKVRLLRDKPYPPGTCFKHALIASMPHRSLYTYFWPGQKTTCRSLVFSAIMRWAHELMLDVRPEAYTWPQGQHRQNDATVVGRVMWVSRRHFETANSHKLNGWQRQRMISNEDAIVPVLTKAIIDWNAKSCLRSTDATCRKLPVYFEFATLELGDHRWYPEQLAALARTNVFIAVHGAGVFNEVWLRPATSSVIEVLHNSGGNYHYGNIASFLGLPYTDMGSAHSPEGIAHKLAEVMDETAVRMAAEHARKAAALAVV